MEQCNEAFITMAIGEKYLRMYNRYFRASQERFARKTGRALIVLTDYIDKSEFGRSRHPAWQALLIFRAEQAKAYDRLCWIDGDIYMTSHSRDPFSEVGHDQWGAARNNAFAIEQYAKSDLDLYKYCPIQGRPEYVLNMGFFVASRSVHAAALEDVYRRYPEQPCYYQGPLSYHLLNDFPGRELDKAFNNLVPAYFMVHGLSIGSLWALVRDSSGVHFCGGVKTVLVVLVRAMNVASHITDQVKWLLNKLAA